MTTSVRAGRFLHTLFLFSFLLLLLLRNAVAEANATELANVLSARAEGVVETSGMIESRKLLGNDDGRLVIGSSRRSLKVRIRGGRGATSSRSAASSNSYYRFPVAFLAAALAAAILNST